MDESGTAGTDEEFYLGGLFIFSSSAARVDKVFGDLLRENASEVHASRQDNRYLYGLMERLKDKDPVPGNMLLVNRRIRGIPDGSSAPDAYASAVIEFVKIGLGDFVRMTGKYWIDDLHLYLDYNNHNAHADFDAVINAERRSGKGYFRGLRHVAKIDSAISRLMQIADIVAYSRRWANSDWSAENLREKFGIHIV